LNQSEKISTHPECTRLLAGARFICSAHFPRDWPDDEGAEVAFVGRSNVGKSSAINAITGQSKLARTSKTPGRTQQIVFFQLSPQQRVVDLPGYGYAKVPENLRRHWERTVRHYLTARESLRALVIPMDIRRPLTSLDQQMVHWASANHLPVHILLTKSDKLGRGRATAALKGTAKAIDTMGEVSVQLFSATHRIGIDEARSTLCDRLDD
jgi:GTP-binding protein